MRKSIKFKILMLMMCLVFGNVFVWIVYFNTTECTKTINKEIIKHKARLTQEQIEDLVKLTPENSHLTYIFNHE